MTGIGGQGIQLASKILAQAASEEGKNVMHFGVYGGVIRGGTSDCTIVASTEELLAPPIIDEAWALVAMHPRSLDLILPKIRQGGVVVANSTLVTQGISRDDCLVIDIPATRLAEQAGNLVGASLIALGGFVEATGFASAGAVLAAMNKQIPTHRRRLIEFNEKCLDLGREHVRANVEVAARARAWSSAQGIAATVS
jgi:2-oxoglutarate ferredoxin oxidoreductase subunit gamma